MNRYIVGFLIVEDRIALIEKRRPDWQNKRLNGIGGHIEPGETPLEAMVREFEEEAGARIEDWRLFCKTTGDDYELYYFVSHSPSSIKSLTDERVKWYLMEEIKNYPLLPNLYYLIPMANYKFNIMANIWHKSPTC